MAVRKAKDRRYPWYFFSSGNLLLNSWNKNSKVSGISLFRCWLKADADGVSGLKSKNSNNFGKWSNKTFDQLLQEANVTYANKYEERWKTLQKADQLVAEEAPLVPLYQLTEARLVADSVQNLVYGPLGSGYYKSVSISDK